MVIIVRNADRNLIAMKVGDKMSKVWLEKTCANCKWEFEGFEGTHCRHCIHNASENFESKPEIEPDIEIRNKTIDEFVSELENHSIYADIGKGNEIKMEWVFPITRIKEVAEKMKKI